METRVNQKHQESCITGRVTVVKHEQHPLNCLGEFSIVSAGPDRILELLFVLEPVITLNPGF